MRQTCLALAALLASTLATAADKPVVYVPEPKFKVFVGIAEDTTPKQQKALGWRAGDIRKELSKDKGWRYQWWLQPVERREDAEIALELTDYERKILGHNLQDNLYLAARLTWLDSGSHVSVIGRSLEQDNASVQQRLLFELCDRLETGAKAANRLKVKDR